MKFLTSVLSTFLLAASYVCAKEVDGVFTSVNRISKSSDSQTSTQIPFDWYDVEVGWTIDTSKIETGDTFSLTMPYVYQVRILNNGILSTYFDITSDDKTIASCDVDNAGGRSLETTITCTLTADLSSYTTFSGTADFLIVFDAGGRTETIESAKKWTSGSNVVTFNGDLSSQVSFSGINTSGRQFISRITMRGDTFYYYAAPAQLCRGGAISSGTFTFEIENDGYELKLEDVEAYYTNQFNSFGFPTSYSNLAITSKTLSSNKRRVTIEFGAIPAGSRFWFSDYSNKLDQNYQLYSVVDDIEVVCQGRGRDGVRETTRLTPVKGAAGGDGDGVQKPVTITTSSTWTRC
ncbi:uncharacterized protein CYBJADRAFT_171555, partial [Cyberlindnera jadinii NRRL Y-1542]